MSDNDTYAERLHAMHEARSLENPRTSLASPAAWAQYMMGAMPTAAGVSVSADTALNISTVYSCVRVLGESVASLPLVVYERLERGKRKASDHRLYPVLHDAPNPLTTSFYFRETAMAHAVLRGNAYAQIQRDGRGQAVGLYGLHADAVKPKRLSADTLVYEVRVEGRGAPKTIPARDMLHVPGLGFDGVEGKSVVGLARETFGGAMAVERYGNAFFPNAIRPSGVVTHPGQLGETALNNLRTSIAEHHAGQTGKPMILEEGMKWDTITIPPEEAQFLQTRQFSVPDICRWFRVPPHLVYDLSRATFSNIEHQSIEFVVHSLRPWLVRWEQELNRKLFTGADAGKFFCEFNVDALLRGDLKSRYDAVAVGRQNGWLNANDIREMENMNPIEGGDVYLVNGNMVPADQAGVKPDPAPMPGKPDEEEDDEPDQPDAARAWIADAAQRIVARETLAMRKAARKPETFAKAVEDFYADHAAHVRRVLAPVGTIPAGFDPDQESVDARSALLAAGSEDEIDRILTRWEAEKAAEIVGKLTESNV